MPSMGQPHVGRLQPIVFKQNPPFIQGEEKA